MLYKVVFMSYYIPVSCRGTRYSLRCVRRLHTPDFIYPMRVAICIDRVWSSMALWLGVLFMLDAGKHTTRFFTRRFTLAVWLSHCPDASARKIGNA